MKATCCVSLVTLLLCAAASWADPAMAAKPGRVPPLRAPEGKITRVSTINELRHALQADREGETILLADGVYDVAGGFLRLDKDGLSLRGASGDPSKVILRGKGFKVHDRAEELIKVEAKGVTIADLTVRDVGSNGIKLQSGANHDLLVHNVHFIDIGERCIKGPKEAVSRNGIVRYCVFEQVTPITRDIPDLQFGGDYIAGMDMMRIDGWRIHDNVFKNIRGLRTRGRGAVFFWIGSSNCIVERNTFIGCDRSISFGNPTGQQDMTGGIIRNNFIYAGKRQAIELCHVDDVKVYNNSIHHMDDVRDQQTILLLDARNVDIRNNIIFSKAKGLSGEGYTAANNLWFTDLSAARRFFVDAPNGDLHLKPTAIEAIDRGVKLAGVESDWDGQPRTASPDVGADETVPAASTQTQPADELPVHPER
jgi:hypothetical protein